MLHRPTCTPWASPEHSPAQGTPGLCPPPQPGPPTPILGEEQLVNTAPSQADGLEQNKQEPSAGAWQSWRRGTAWRLTSGLSLLHTAHLEGCHTLVTSGDNFQGMNLGLVWPQQQKGWGSWRAQLQGWGLSATRGAWVCSGTAPTLLLLGSSSL